MQVKLTIGERLKDLRVERKLTLEQLAAEVGISKSALGKYESDNGKDISPYSILLLADYYGVSCDYLMGRTETKNHTNTALHELHLGDASIDVLRTCLLYTSRTTISQNSKTLNSRNAHRRRKRQLRRHYVTLG